MANETSSNNADLPYCHQCFKTLPASFRGFDLCPTCFMYQEERRTAFKMKLPSYKSPLAALDEKYARANR